MKFKKTIQKFVKTMLASLMIFTSLNFTGLEVQAATGSYQAKSSLVKAFSVDGIWGKSSASVYQIRLDGTNAFCLDLGSTMTGNIYLDRVAISNVKLIEQVKKAVIYADRVASGNYSSHYKEMAYWISQTLIWGYQEGYISSSMDLGIQPGSSFGESKLVIQIGNVMRAAGMDGYINDDIGETLNEINNINTSGYTFYMYKYKSGYQRLITTEPGYKPTYNSDEVQSRKTYTILDPVFGHEQGGVRPVLVIQNERGNKYSPTTIVACITSKAYKKTPVPAHYYLPDSIGMFQKSIVLLEQVRVIDKDRLHKRVAILSKKEMRAVNKRILISFGLNRSYRKYKSH